MSALREAAQQALEALELYVPKEDYENKPVGNVMDTLRAALAQEQAEPLNLLDRAVQKRLAAQWGHVPAERAEPVAWVECDGELVWNNREAAIGRNLYTAPPQRTMVPLTEDEIYRTTKHHGVSKYTTINIARAIEKASWEKNYGQA